MLLTPTNTIKRRLARQWSKMQNNARWTYNVADTAVINNKPHIVLTTYTPERPQQPAQPMQFMTLDSLFGRMNVPADEEVEDEELPESPV